MGIFFWKSRNVTLEEIERKVGLDLSTGMILKTSETSETSETYKEYGEEHGELKFFIKKNYKEIEAKLEQHYGKNLINTGYNYPQYKNRSLWGECKKEK